MKKESVQKESRGDFSVLLSLVLLKTGCRTMFCPALLCCQCLYSGLIASMFMWLSVNRPGSKWGSFIPRVCLG